MKGQLSKWVPSTPKNEKQVRETISHLWLTLVDRYHMEMAVLFNFDGHCHKKMAVVGHEEGKNHLADHCHKEMAMLFNFDGHCHKGMSVVDRRKVFGGGPWLVEKQLLALEVPMGIGVYAKLAFDRDMGRVLSGKFIRARVGIDISKLLPKLLKVSLIKRELKSNILFKYERLPELCYCCGIVGHPIRECISLPPTVVSGHRWKYGDNIKATSVF
ncbi:hypothetical protein G4B88_016843 [Cannabis sativa]|uniref:Zinc knuckle CX2CX4HX4C domain-containing protein n=1 Tax=Cannabis sativa TaxID=3483 RepID=A0A7J6GN23_CANSA|nr:hypothetical protein G4B88_016843 [Cannabis sativa]